MTSSSADFHTLLATTYMPAAADQGVGRARKPSCLDPRFLTSEIFFCPISQPIGYDDVPFRLE